MRAEQCCPRLVTRTFEAELLRRTLPQAMRYVRSLICALGGHSTMLHFEPGRLRLRCFRCGHKTAGWEIAIGTWWNRAQATERSSIVAPLGIAARKPTSAGGDHCGSPRTQGNDVLIPTPRRRPCVPFVCGVETLPSPPVL